jgi:hypothetical protein
MKSIFEMTQGELAAFIDSHLREQGISVVLSGGASVAVYSDHKYVSKDLDFIRRDLKTEDEIVSAMDELGPPPARDPEARNIALMQWDHVAFTNEQISCRQYTFLIEAEYHIVFQGHGQYFGIWPCGPFYVEATQ